MHTIEISEATYQTLQLLAVPFVDTPDTVIGKLSAAELERRQAGLNHVTQQAPAGSPSILDPDFPENLTHTRPLRAQVDGKDLHRPKWNGILDSLHVLARARLGSFEAVRKASAANLKEHSHDQNGYRYLPQADLSIQGVDANLAWSHTLRLARALKVPVEVTFEWRDKEGAARPGDVATLKWEP